MLKQLPKKWPKKWPKKQLVCSLALCAVGCMRQVDYSVKNVEIEAAPQIAGQYTGDVKILKLSSTTSNYQKWRIVSDQVRITLPHFSGANELLSVVSGGDASPKWVFLRLEFDRYSPLESGKLTPVYNPRLSIPCDGWSVEVKGRKYPVDRSTCTQDLVFGVADKDAAILQFPVADESIKEFKVHSPSWRINWQLNSAGPEGYPEESFITPPDIIFYRSGTRRSLDLAIR